MKTMLENVGILDMRSATEESVANIAEVGNVGVALVSPESKGLLSRMKVGNMGAMVELAKDAELAVQNGSFVLAADTLPANKTFLMINGQIRVERDVTPEQITASLSGGIVNGQLLANRAQMSALQAAGVQINGAVVVYPDGASIRHGKAPLTAAEVQSAQEPIYLTPRVEIEKGTTAILAEKGLVLYGEKGALVPEREAEAFYAVWKGSGKVLRLPEGFTLMQGRQDIKKSKALLLRGKRYVAGSVFLHSDVRGEDLRALEALHVEGTLFVPVALLDTVLPLLVNEPELVPYEGTGIIMDGVQKLSGDLDTLPEQVAIFADGVLTIAPDADARALKARITLLYVDGVLALTQAQQMALLPVTVMDGTVKLHEEEDDEDEVDPDVNVIGNSMIYVL